MRNRRRMEWKKKKMVKFEGWRAAVRAKFRIVGGCMCVCLLDWWMSSAPGLWLGLPGEPFLPSPLSTPPRVVRSRAPCNGGREGNEEKERERAEWKRRGESEWLGERERSIFETPVPLGTELLSPPHAQWRSKGGGQLDYVLLLCLFPGYSTNGSLGQRGGAL